MTFSRTRPLVLFGFAVLQEDGQVEVWDSDDAGLIAVCAEFPGTSLRAWVSAVGWVLRNRSERGCRPPDG